MAARLTAKSFVGKEIRRAREDQEMSRAALGKAVLVSESLVAAWESGRQAVRPDHIRQLIGVLRFKPEIMERMVDELVNGEVQPEWEGKWLAAEKRATSLWSFEISVVPGLLLQVPGYARAVLASEELVIERLERQEILAGDASPTLVTLISETALRLNVGGSQVMVAQLDFLASAADHDNIIIQIVPMESSVCAKFTGPFMIATLESGQEVAYVDSAISGEVIERPEDIAALRRMFDRFRADALRQTESLDLIRRLAERWAA